MAEEQSKSNPIDDSKNQEKTSDLQKKILDLKKQEKQLHTEINKLSDKSLENYDKSLKSVKEYSDMLDKIVKQRKIIQDQLKDIANKNKEEQSTSKSIGENLKNAIKYQTALSELEKEKLVLVEKLQKLQTKKIDPKLDLQTGKQFLAQKIKEIDAEKKLNEERKKAPKSDIDQIKKRISQLNFESLAVKKLYEQKSKVPPAAIKPLASKVPLFEKQKPVAKAPIVKPIPDKKESDSKISIPQSAPKIDLSNFEKSISAKKKDLEITNKLNQASKIVPPKIDLKEAEAFWNQKNKELEITKKINEEKKKIPKGDSDQIKKRIVDLTSELDVVRKVYEEKKKVPPTPKPVDKVTSKIALPPVQSKKPAIPPPPPPIKKISEPLFAKKLTVPQPPVKTPVKVPTPTTKVVTKTIVPPVDKTQQKQPAFPFDKAQLIEINKKGLEESLKKYERSPSLGVTLDKDNSGMFDKLIGSIKGVFDKLSTKPKPEQAKQPKVEKQIAKKAEPIKLPKEEKPVAKKAEPINQEINVKTNIDNAPLNDALSITTQINEANREDIKTLLEANRLLNEELKIIQAQQNVSFSYKKQQKEKLLGEIEVNKEKLRGLGIDEKSVAQKAEPVKPSKEEKPVAKKAEPKPAAKPVKPESITQEINVETNVDSKPLDKGLSLIDAMKQSNEDDVKTLLEKNRVMTDGLKTIQQQQNVSTAYKKQKQEELLQLIEINKEKLTGLGIDKQMQASIQSGQAPMPETKPPATPKATEGMAPPTPEIDVEGQESSAAAYERSLSAARGIAEMAKEIAKEEGYYSDKQKQNIKLLEKSISIREGIEASIEAAIEEGRDLEDIEKSISKNVQSRIFAQNRLKELQSSGLVDVNSTLEKQKAIEKAMKDQEVAEKKVAEIRKRLISQGETDYEVIEKAIKAEQIKADAAASEVDQLKSKMHLHEIEYISLNKAVQEYNKVNDALKKQKQHQKDINDRMGLFGKSIQVLGGVLDHFGVGKFLKLNEAIDAMRQKAADGGSKLSVMFTGLGNILKNVAKSLMDPVAIITGVIGLFTMLIKKAVEFQSKNFEAAKALGMSVTEAGKLRDRFDQIANKNGQLALTSGQLLETQQKMNEQLGFMAPATEEFATQTTLIMRRFGASAESMAELQLYAAKTGKTLQSTFATVVGTGKAEAAKLKMHMTEKQILDQVSKVSATVQMNFKGSLKELAAGVVQAQKMGLSLDKINKIGEGLLDFESSVSKEMEAQLLTGKEIDLSKARELALAGDTKGLMAEMNKQIGSQAEYEKMNVIQKQAYAEALGMSKDEMDEMYHKQKMAKELGELANATQGEQYNALVKQHKSHAEIANIMGQQAADDAQRASVQEKMATAMERVNEIIGKASQAFMPLVEKVVAFLSDTKNVEMVVHRIVEGVKAVGSAFMAVGRFLKEHMTLVKAIAATYVGIKITMGLITFQQKLSNMLGNKQKLIDGQTLGIQKQKEFSTKTEAITEKANQGVKKVSQTIDQTRLGITRARGAAAAVEGTKEKVNAGFSIAGAIAKVTGGSGWMGPAALGVGALAATLLFGYLAKVGGGGGGSESGSGGGGGTAGFTPLAPAGKPGEIKPMNQAAETQKTVSTALTTSRKEGDRRGDGPLNVTVVNNIDPITGKSIQKVVANDPSTYVESSKIAARTTKS